MAEGEAPLKELAQPFAMSLPGVAKHLKVLERAGLIERGRDAQWRPARLRGEALREAAEWIEPYRRYWDTRLGHLDAYLEELQADGGAASDAPAGPGERG